VENGRQPDAGRHSAKLSACSACAGDYEDPDRTAWPEEDEPDPEEPAGEKASVRDFLTSKKQSQE